VQEIYAAAETSSSAFAALIWWLVPFFAVLGAIIYVTWVAKFKDKYASETNRSVTKFQSFQDSFRDDTTPNT
jgi:type II secretory pathway component PulF